MNEAPCNLRHRETSARCYKERHHLGNHQAFAHYPGQLVCWTERVDRRCRRIGYNWWREHICDLLFAAETVWLNDREAVALGYQTEMEEYALENPRPTLKAFLIEQAGMHREPSA